MLECAPTRAFVFGSHRVTSPGPHPAGHGQGAANETKPKRNWLGHRFTRKVNVCLATGVSRGAGSCAARMLGAGAGQAAALKQQGNEYFKAKDYDMAKELYVGVIGIMPCSDEHALVGRAR